MMVTDIVRDSQVYRDGVWYVEEADPEKEIRKYNEDPRRFTSYLWGIAITCLAQRNLFTAIKALGDDYIYSDTDSVKYMNRQDHISYFQAYNNDVVRKLERAMEFHGFDPERIRPKTVKGVEKVLGVWDWETLDGPMQRFRTLGAKRYMVQEADGTVSLTVSGLNKHVAVPYLMRKYKTPQNVFNHFSDRLYIPPKYTGKNTHTYLNDATDGTVTDYLGVSASYHEESSVHLEAAEYRLGIADAYMDYLIGIEERIE